MTLSEKNTILDWVARESDFRLKALRRIPVSKDGPDMFKALGEVKESEKIYNGLTKLLKKL